MRATLSASLMAVLAAASLSACSGSSNSANGAADQTAATSSAADNGAAADNAAASDNSAAADNSATSDNTAASSAPAVAGAAVAAPPVYPGAAAGARPKGIADGAPPQAKAYSTSDDEAKVQAWYKAQLKGAGELGANGNVKDVFLVGKAAQNGMIVMLATSGGKTWIVIGPAGPK